MLLQKPWKNKRLKTPTLLQMEALECGAACLGIVLHHFGRFAPLEELRVQCGVSRDGSKASNILKAGRTYGLECKGYRMEPERLRELPLPAIIHWDFNHFVVLEGIKSDRAYLNDPACGPRSVSLQELDESFTGVALACQPGPDFQPGGKRSKALAWLFSQSMKRSQALWLLVLTGLTLVFPGLLVPLFGQFFVDEILVQGQRGWLKPLLFGMALTAILRGVLSWTRGQVLVTQRLQMAATMSARFMHHLLRLPYAFFNQRFAGELGNRMQLNDSIADLLTGELASAAVSAFTAVFFVFLMVAYDPLLTAVGVSFALGNVLLLRWVNRRRADLNRRMLQEAGSLTGEAMGGLQLIETLKATASEADFLSRFSSKLALLKQSQQNLAIWTFPSTAGAQLLHATSTALVLGAGALRVMDGEMTMGMLVAFQSLMSSFLGPFEKLVALGASLQTIQADVERIRDVLACEADPIFGRTTQAAASLTQPDADPDLADKEATGDLRFENVTFGYSPLAAPLIRDFTLHLPPGSRVALVGGSGSGKSTVARLACGLLLPWQGAVLFNGAPLEKHHHKGLAGAMTLVDQDIVLFAGTVRDNIAMWRNDLDEARLFNAARDAMIHEHILSLPGGYDAPVLESGGNFSGGQRQRLEIARALAMNPALIVLDEATSALDPEIEKQVVENINRRGVTCLIVAHRLSTIRDSDAIIVMDRGAVVERGTHEELMQSDGPYKRLIEN